MTQQVLFFGFVIIFILYYITIIKFQKKALFFTLVIVAIVYILYIRNVEKEKKEMNNISTFISNVENDLVHESEIPEDKVFSVHKTPKNINFIKKFPDFQNILYELRYLKKYDKPLYDKIVTYLEYFLRMHYKIMIGKYDFALSYQSIKDVRNELLNTLKTIPYNVPEMSSFEKNTELIRSITFNYIRTLFHKYPVQHFSYKAPFEHDTNKNNQYHAF